MNKEIVISIKTIFIALLMILAGYVVYRLGSVIGIILISLLLVVSLEPLVRYFMRGTLFNRPVPRNVAVLISYALFLVILAGVLGLVLPPFFSQAQRLVASISQILVDLKISATFSQLSVLDFLPEAKNISGGVWSATMFVFSNATLLFSILVLSIYMSLDWENIKKHFVEIFPRKIEDDVTDTISEIQDNIGHWVKGELLLMLTVGLLSFLGLWILGINYPLALGLVSGALEIIPMIGPLISAVLAGVIGFAQSPTQGIGAVVLFIVVQQFENNLLVPKVMQKVSGFSPVIVLLAILIGSEFFGIIGAITAVPAMMVIITLTKRFLAKSN